VCGYQGAITPFASQSVRTTVATAVVATVAEAWVDGAALMILTTDGVHDQVSTTS
jgi:hypothetical protein